MSAVTVTPDPAHPAGHALVRVAGAAEHLATPGFRLQRDAGWGDDKLGPGGWQSSDALLQPAHAERDGADLLLHVGWDVCHHLEAGVYELSVPVAGVEPTGVFWPDIVPLHAGSLMSPVPSPPPPRTPGPVTPMPKPAEADATIRVAPAPSPPQPAAPPQAAKPGPAPPVPGVSANGGRAAVLGGIVLLLLAVGGAYYALHGSADRVQPQVATVTPPVVPSAPPPTPEPAPVPPAATVLGRLSVPDVIAKAPDPAAIRAEGEQRLAGDRKDDGLLLLEVASERADAAAAAALARLYDPVVFQPGGPIPRADARQAARYYRDAARGGADVAAARDALRSLLQTQAQGGNMGADLMLKDFWP